MMESLVLDRDGSILDVSPRYPRIHREWVGAHGGTRAKIGLALSPPTKAMNSRAMGRSHPEREPNQTGATAPGHLVWVDHRLGEHLHRLTPEEISLLFFRHPATHRREGFIVLG